MKRFFSILLCALMILGLLSGCKKQEENTMTEGERDADEPVTLTVWHDGDETIMSTIADYVNEKLSADQITLTFEKKSGLSDQIKLYGNDAKNGPDFYFYAHDSLGIFVEMGVLAPITNALDTEKLSGLIPMTVEAGTYQDTKYLLPVYFETLLFMYNKDLWEGEVPDTTEGLYEYMKAHTDVNNSVYAVVNQHSTAYNVAPVINGFGGYIIDAKGNPGLNEDLTKQAVEYNEKFAELEADGDYNTVTTLFNEGKAAAIIGGPWLVPGIKEANINLGIVSLADIKLPNGNGLAPYSGVQGIGVMKHAVEENKEAVAKVLEAMTDAELGIRLATKANCAPANEASYQDETVSANEMIFAIKETAQTAKPMPNIPEMGVMWTPTESLLAAVNKSGADLDEAANQYQEEAVAAIADMK
ncbi:MAG: extracellular solute-binding protein [Lachnospiraceae bacterium]|nr:extracellular solute-binding protein [Lachnospiraceae bacterium]